CNAMLASASCQVGHYVSRKDQLPSISSRCKEVIDLLLRLKPVDIQPLRGECLESRRIEPIDLASLTEVEIELPFRAANRTAESMFEEVIAESEFSVWGPGSRGPVRVARRTLVSHLLK